MPRNAFKKGATLNGKNFSHGEQILSFKSSPYGIETKYFMLMSLYCNIFLTPVTHMRYVRTVRYAYAISLVK